MKNLFKVMCVLSTLFASASQAQSKGKVLFVVTNVNQLPDHTPSGIHFNELTHPYYAFLDSGYKIDFASIKGGIGPVDPATLDQADPMNKRFWSDPALRSKIARTLSIKNVSAQAYEAIFLVGGVSTMWDFPFSAELATLVAEFYDHGKVVGAVCHGPAGLVNVRLADGSYLVQGKNISAFTNEEEQARNRESTVPFLLESRLISLGATFAKAANFKYYVVSDRRLVTGQNPASAFGVAHEMIRILRAR